MDLDFDAAFAPVFDATAVFSGSRREAGASAARVLSLTVPCSLFDGSPADPLSGAVAPGSQVDWTILIRRADWTDHQLPQTGDAVAIDGYPPLQVVQTRRLGAMLSVQLQSQGHTA